MAEVAVAARMRLRRWLVAVGLTVAAEDTVRVDTPETNAMALLGAHAACEALLGLLAGIRRYKRGEEVPFPTLLASANAKVSISSDLADDLDVTHRMRNDFVHASVTVDGDEAARAIMNARRLMDLVPASLGTTWTIPDGAGLGTAVAEIVGVEVVGIWLRHADQMHAEGRLVLATDDLARALHYALRRTHPRLIPLRDDGKWVRELRWIGALGLESDRAAEITASQIDGLHRWVLPLALGISPCAYERLLGLVGTVMDADGGRHAEGVKRPDAVPTEADVRRATSQTVCATGQPPRTPCRRRRPHRSRPPRTPSRPCSQSSARCTGEGRIRRAAWQLLDGQPVLPNKFLLELRDEAVAVRG